MLESGIDSVEQTLRADKVKVEIPQNFPKTMIFQGLGLCAGEPPLSWPEADLGWISAAERKITPEAEKKITGLESFFESSFLIIL